MRMTRHPPGGAGLPEETALVLIAFQSAVLDLDRDLAKHRNLGSAVYRGVPAVRQHGQAAQPGDGRQTGRTLARRNVTHGSTLRQSAPARRRPYASKQSRKCSLAATFTRV